jgi:predicted Zn-dependent protease
LASSRLETLRKFVAQSPNDPFPRYGLAMELKNAGRPDEAEATFAELEARFPDYVPQYLMRANLLVAMGRGADARATLARGIVVAARAGNGHAKGEMEAALDALDG